MALATGNIHTEVPGSIFLVDDTEIHHDTNHDGAVVLHPHPSTDPEDPLNWSRARKYMAVGMVYLYVFAIGIATAVQYSVLTQIADDTGITVSQLNLGTGLMFLFLGWACLIWQPLAVAYGRRGVFIVSTILSIIPMVWAPYSKGPGQWYAHRILLGIFASPVESLPEVSVPDLFFAHERGSFMAIYAFVLFGSNFFAPFFAGFINDAVGWKWVMNFGALVLAVCAVIMFFLMEDTIYFRKSSEGAESDDNDEKTPGTGVAVQPIVEHPKPRTYMQKLNLVTFQPGHPSPIQTLQKSWRALCIFVYFPSIAWAGLLYGTNLAWYNVMNATMSSILNAEPYNFPPAMVGVAYLSPVIGAGLSIIWSGTLSDWVVLRLARRNGGIREPEQRLWGLLVSGLVTSAGLILWGVGASKGVQFMGLIIGVGMVTFGVVCGGSISLAYAVDCFKDIAGESMITVIIIRNTLGFGFSYGINPWINNLGLRNCFVSVALIALACTYSFLIIIVIGKSLRKFSAKQYWKYVAEDRGVLSD